jgi:glucokinase
MSHGEKKYGIGIDLGGTKIMVGVVDLASGNVLASVRKKTHAERGAKAIVERVNKMTHEALEAANLPANENVTGIGIGVAGQLDRQKGVVLSSPNLPFERFPLCDRVQDELRLPVMLANDVEAAAYGELFHGAGKGCPLFVCVFVGTGIGGGIVQDGKLYRGASGTGGELGHMTVVAGGRICGCGSRGCLEAYSSRTAMTHAISAEIKRGRHSVVKQELEADGGVLRSGVIAEAIQAGDELVTEVAHEAAEYLGYGLASIINFYNPQKMILGGGVIEALDLIYEHATHRARHIALLPAAHVVEFSRTVLGDNAGTVGAATLAGSVAAAG